MTSHKPRQISRLRQTFWDRHLLCLERTASALLHAWALRLTDIAREHDNIALTSEPFNLRGTRRKARPGHSQHTSLARAWPGIDGFLSEALTRQKVVSCPIKACLAIIEAT